MAYASPNGTNNALASKDIEDFPDIPEAKQDRYLRQAYRTVRDLAPHPDLVNEDYREAARDAELAVVEYMLTTQGGVLKSSALSGVGNDSYAGLDAVQRMVANAMGGYYVGEVAEPPSEGVTGGASVFNVSDEPLF